MKTTDTINLSDEDHVNNIDFIYQYLFVNILATVYSEAAEFTLRLHQNKWYASMRKDGDFIPLVDPLDFKIAELKSYLRSICHGVRNADGMGDFDGITSFQVDDELVFGMFWFGDDPDGQWISLRLLYGETAPDTAKVVLDRYRRRKLFG